MGAPSKVHTKKTTVRKEGDQCLCIFAEPDNCIRCPYKQFLLDLLDHSVQIIRALPDKS